MIANFLSITDMFAIKDRSEQLKKEKELLITLLNDYKNLPPNAEQDILKKDNTLTYSAHYVPLLQALIKA